MNETDALHYAKILQYATRMSAEEKDCLLSDLVCTYFAENESLLISLLLEGRILEFKVQCDFLNKPKKEKNEREKS